MHTRKAIAVLVAVSISTLASAAVFNWTGGGDGVNFEDGANWNQAGAVPGASDLVFPGAGANVTISSNQEVDSYRTADGGTLNQTAGTLTIGTSGGDVDSFFGEFGPGNNTHNMSGSAALVVNDTGLTMWGRSGGTDSLTMTGSSSINVAGGGEAWLGMDGSFTGSLSDSSSLSVLGSMQMARYASPSSTMALSGGASLTVGGFLVMSDHATLSGNSSISINGSGVSASVGGLFMRENATLSFIADGLGISTVSVSGPSDLFDNGGGLDPQLSVDLSAYSGSGDITLIDMSTGTVNGQFRDLAEGTVVPGTGGRTITYAGGADGFDVALIPEPSTLALVGLFGGVTLFIRRRFTI